MGPSIIIDDTDPAIQYHGGAWLQCSAPNITDIGQAGSPMFETLHMLPTANGTLTYSFNGTGISAFVSNFAFDGNYTVECLLDGGSGQIFGNLTLHRSNNIELCTFGGLDVNKTHNFTLDVTFPPEQHQNETGPTGFLFDYFLIAPPPSMSLQKRDLLYSTFDPFVRSALIGNTWAATDVTGGGYEAGSEVAQFNISFTGIATWWYGFRAPHNPKPDGQSMFRTTYSVDATTSVQFDTLPFHDISFLDGVSSGELTNQLLFHTPELQYGNHTLKVFSPGTSDAGVNPLTIQNLAIQGTPSNNSLPVQTTIIPSLSTGEPFIMSTPDDGPQSKIDVGKVVGGIAGGILAIVVIAVWFIIARRKRVRQNEAGDLNIDYSSTEPLPFQADPDTVGAGPLKARETQEDTVNPFMQELEAPPLTKWTRGLARQSGSQLLPSAVESQLPQPEVDDHPGSHLQATVLDTNRSSLPPPHDYNANDETARSPLEVDPIREEDSGMRLAPQGSRETFVPVLPPVYTAH